MILIYLWDLESLRHWIVRFWSNFYLCPITSSRQLLKNVEWESMRCITVGFVNCLGTMCQQVFHRNSFPFQVECPLIQTVWTLLFARGQSGVLDTSLSTGNNTICTAIQVDNKKNRASILIAVFGIHCHHALCLLFLRGNHHDLCPLLQLQWEKKM